ncbi:hypothetical protein VA599_06485 [Chromobacterium sp. TRC.1.1.SA]|uniref:Holin n=1 Tax=Chromobacterium indicum TaxID=3110228 RepID=A0ABV0CGU7_9NEIS
MVSNIFYAALGGAAGGLVTFLLGLLNEHYKNNNYIVKAMCEIAGGFITALALNSTIEVFSHFLSDRLFLSGFLIGISWASIIQAIRNFVTRHVKNTLESSK